MDLQRSGLVSYRLAFEVWPACFMNSLFQRRPAPATALLLTVGAVAVASLIRLGIRQWATDMLPYGPYYPAVALAAIYGGLATGIFAIGLSVVSVLILLGASSHVEFRDEAVAMITFACASAVIVALCAQLRDLTLRLVDLTQHLRRSEARLGAVVDQALVGMAEVDLDGRVVRTNHQLTEILGTPRERLIGRSVYSLIDRDDEPQLRALFKKLIEQGAGFVLEGRGRRGDGSYLWLQIRGSAIQTGGELPELAVVVFNDLTSHRHVEETLRAQVREYAG